MKKKQAKNFLRRRFMKKKTFRVYVSKSEEKEIPNALLFIGTPPIKLFQLKKRFFESLS